ncbi:MAG: hypothetical protein QM579_09005 [Desulfovibrio sp.]|uniref:hypothetical protein n=1 Tax=Desulfovibrio sp. TaxID=885 RepID=UPI0039E29C9C
MHDKAERSKNDNKKSLRQHAIAAGYMIEMRIISNIMGCYEYKKQSGITGLFYKLKHMIFSDGI